MMLGERIKAGEDAAKLHLPCRCTAPHRQPSHGKLTRRLRLRAIISERFIALNAPASMTLCAINTARWPQSLPPVRAVTVPSGVAGASQSSGQDPVRSLSVIRQGWNGIRNDADCS